jgi:hypothetical protein
VGKVKFLGFVISGGACGGTHGSQTRSKQMGGGGKVKGDKSDGDFNEKLPTWLSI